MPITSERVNDFQKVLFYKHYTPDKRFLVEAFIYFGIKWEKNCSKE